MIKKAIKYSITLILAFYSIEVCYSQTRIETLDSNEKYVFYPDEKPPVFPGGEKEMYCFIDHSINKKLLSTVDTSGVVWAKFTIDSTGIVTDIKITKPLTKTADNELRRVIELMPRWIPAKIGNKNIDAYFNLPLKIPYENKFCR
jgi:hypothetical protein